MDRGPALIHSRYQGVCFPSQLERNYPLRPWSLEIFVRCLFLTIQAFFFLSPSLFRFLSLLHTPPDTYLLRTSSLVRGGICSGTNPVFELPSPFLNSSRSKHSLRHGFKHERGHKDSSKGGFTSIVLPPKRLRNRPRLGSP